METERGQVVPFPGTTWPRPPKNRWPLVVIALVISALLAVLAWQVGAEGRAIRALPLLERGQLYAQEVANFRALCLHAPDALSEPCQAKAHLLQEFPECDEACRALTRR